MFCTKCGNLNQGKRYCTRCGAALSRGQQQVNLLTIREMATFFIPAPSVTQNDLSTPVVATKKLSGSAITRQFGQMTMPASAPTQPVALALPRKNAAVQVSLLLLALLAMSGFWWSRQPSLLGRVQALFVTPSVTAQPLEQNALANVRQSFAANAVETKPVAAWQVIAEETRDTGDAQNAVVADQQMATIAPGGQLALAFQAGDFFGNGPQADLQIYGDEQAHVSYRVFVRSDAAATWRRIDINRRGFAHGVAQHDMGHHGISQARQLLILNDAPTPLQIDAVVALHQDAVFETVSHHQH